MKKIISLILITAMLLSAFAVYASANVTEADAAILIGDADKDGLIRPKDALAVKLYVAGNGNGISKSGGDTDSDGKVTARDVYRLKLYFAEIITSFTQSTAQIKRLRIAGNDISAYTVIREKDYSKNCSQAAKDIVEYIEKATGTELNMVDEEDLTVFPDRYIIVKNDKNLPTDGVSIKVEGGNVFVCGGGSGGCYYAAVEFLERFIGWVFINKDYQYLSANETVDIEEGKSYYHVPVIKDRDSQTYSYEDDNSGDRFVSAVRLKINSWKNRGSLEYSTKEKRYGYGEGYIGTAHTYSTYAPSYCPDNQSYICFNSEGALNQVIENVTSTIQELIDAGKSRSRISVSPMDNPYYCKCSLCAAQYRSGKSIMGAQLRFTNKVADAIKAAFPDEDIHIMTTAYWMARKPPVDVKCADNVDVLFCWAGCMNHSFTGEDCYADGNYLYYNNIKERSYFEAWCAMCDTVYVWIYCAFYTAGLGQPMFIDNIRENIKYLADNNVYGIYCEGNYGTNATYQDGNCLDLLQMYLLARLMWDPYMSDSDFQMYEDEFLTAYYGKEAAGYIKQYIDINCAATDAVNDCWTNNCDTTFDCLSLDYLEDNADTVFTLIDSALEAEKTTDQQYNMQRLAASAYWLCLSATYESDFEDGDDDSQELYSERYTRLYSWVKELPLLDDSNETFRESYPELKGNISNPFLWEGWGEFYHRNKAASDDMAKWD